MGLFVGWGLIKKKAKTYTSLRDYENPGRLSLASAKDGEGEVDPSQLSLLYSVSIVGK